jgi:threonine dehydratase
MTLPFASFLQRGSTFTLATLVAIAAAKAYPESEQIQEQSLIAVACGANMNFDRLRFSV